MRFNQQRLFGCFVPRPSSGTLEILKHRAVIVGPLQPAFQDLWMCLSACVFPLPSFLSLFRPAWSVWLPTVHAVAKYTHISNHSTTTDRVLSGHREVLGIRAKGTFDKKQQGVHARKQKLGALRDDEPAFIARGEKRERNVCGCQERQKVEEHKKTTQRIE